MEQINPFTLNKKEILDIINLKIINYVKTETETEILKDMGEWSRKHFGYKKDGYLHFNGKKTKIDDDDFDEWED